MSFGGGTFRWDINSRCVLEVEHLDGTFALDITAGKSERFAFDILFAIFRECLVPGFNFLCKGRECRRYGKNKGMTRECQKIVKVLEA